MKRVLIVSLMCINAALLVALVFGAGAQPAHAQALAGRTDYVVISGHIYQDFDSLYVIDLATRRLAVLRYDKAKNALLLATRRDLRRDFPAAGR